MNKHGQDQHAKDRTAQHRTALGSKKFTLVIVDGVLICACVYCPVKCKRLGALGNNGCKCTIHYALKSESKSCIKVVHNPFQIPFQCSSP